MGRADNLKKYIKYPLCDNSFKGLQKGRKDDKIREAYQKAGDNYNVKQVFMKIGGLYGLFTRCMWKFIIFPNKAFLFSMCFLKFFSGLD